MLNQERSGVKAPQRYILACLIFLTLGLAWWPQTTRAQSNNLVISSLGLSQAQGTTFLTMILSRPEQPKIQAVADPQDPQLLIDFPKARVFEVPLVQVGDGQLVKQVRTMAIPGQDGVRIVLELVPGRPYTFWRASRTTPRGSFQFVIGLRPDAAVPAPAEPRVASPAPVGPATPETPASGAPRPSETRQAGRTGSADYRQPTAGTMVEIFNLMPAAGPVLEFLERQGWTAQRDSGGRQGSPGSQRFVMANPSQPDLSVVAEHIPTRASQTPAINIIAVSTDKLTDPEANKYRQMVRWDLATIKKHFEDIGDYYDDGLKPLRIRLRERSKAVFLREFDFLQQFLEVAVPQKPGLASQIKKHVDDKPNKRLEGAQYTESEYPLVILDMVDFYTIRVYFMDR